MTGRTRAGAQRHGSQGDQLQLPAGLAGAPSEDIGAVTHARYRYQWEIGARALIGMLVDNRLQALLCEWHEDHVLIFSDGEAELISVKHREGSESPWTLRGLCVTGGVAHLYDRWLRLHRRHRVRVVTNAGLNTDQGEAADFAAACHSRSNDAVRPFARRIMTHLGAESEEDTARFCMELSVESGAPGRGHITATNVHDLMNPALTQLGMQGVDPDRAYEACVALVESASRDEAQRLTLEDVGDIGRSDSDAVLAAVLRSRLITRDVVRATVTRSAATGSPLLAPSGPVSIRSRLARKLEQGGIGQTGIQSAQRLRAIWSELEARFREDLAGADSEMGDLRTRVLSVVSAVENQVLSSGAAQPIGRELKSALERELRVAALGRVPGVPIDDAHLMGLVYQLTDECEIWWSEVFDMSTAS